MNILCPKKCAHSTFFFRQKDYRAKIQYQHDKLPLLKKKKEGREKSYKAKSIGFISWTDHCVFVAVLRKEEPNIRNFIKNGIYTSIFASF